MHFTKGKKLIRRACQLCDSNSMTSWKRQNYEDKKKMSGFQGWRNRTQMVWGAMELLCIIP